MSLPNIEPEVLSKELIRVREAEREHLARELHDDLGQNLTAVKINLQAMAASHPGMKTLLDDSIQIVDRMLQAVQDLSLELRPPMLEGGLVAALRSHISAESSRGGLRVAFETTIDAMPLRSDVALALFRIVQESMANILRHARAHHAWVTLHCRNNVIELSIRDDGQGFDKESHGDITGEKARSFGLKGMRERAVLLGGDLSIESRPGMGTTIVASVPV
jgi:signal transduction histidine kinase